MADPAREESVRAQPPTERVPPTRRPSLSVWIAGLLLSAWTLFLAWLAWFG